MQNAFQSAATVGAARADVRLVTSYYILGWIVDKFIQLLLRRAQTLLTSHFALSCGYRCVAQQNESFYFVMDKIDKCRLKPESQ